MTPRFALVGVAGYVAPRHLKAIRDVGGDLLVCHDKSDTVGCLDSFFPNSYFFTYKRDFEDYCTLLKKSSTPLSWLTICTPNHTHETYIRYGLKLGCDVICEKPVVLVPEVLSKLISLESRTGRCAYTILQLRLHPTIIQLKEEVQRSNAVQDVELTYITSRGRWYYNSWKGDEQKSGGVATNIGIHLYDMLQWVFGKVQQNVVHVKSFDRVAGFLSLEKANVRYFLSINEGCLPKEVRESSRSVYRCLNINGRQFDFSTGFSDLHSECYWNIMKGKGVRIAEAIPSIEIVSSIRGASPIGLIGDYHPIAKMC